MYLSWDAMHLFIEAFTLILHCRVSHEKKLMYVGDIL